MSPNYAGMLSQPIHEGWFLFIWQTCVVNSFGSFNTFPSRSTYALIQANWNPWANPSCVAIVLCSVTSWDLHRKYERSISIGEPSPQKKRNLMSCPMWDKENQTACLLGEKNKSNKQKKRKTTNKKNETKKTERTQGRLCRNSEVVRKSRLSPLHFSASTTSAC